MMNKIEVDPLLLQVIQNSVTAGVNEGIKRGMESIRNAEILKEKTIYDNRFKNTKLLIRNYRKFIYACEQATCTEEELETATVSEILDKLYCSQYDDSTAVQSILVSRKRTEIIISHIKRIVNMYIIEAENSKNDERSRRAYIIEDLYIKGKKQPSIYELSEKYHISERQVGRDRNAATEEIAILMFRNRWNKKNVLMSKTCPLHVVVNDL